MTGRLRLLAVFLFIAYLIQGLYLIYDKSPVEDAVTEHLVSGYTYLKWRDFRMSPGVPPLAKEISAMPWLIWNPELDPGHPSWERGDSAPFANYAFFYGPNRPLAWKLLLASRLTLFLLGPGVILVVVLWARRVHGPPGALIAMALGAFCPSFVGYSAVVGTEMALAFFVISSAYCLYRFHAAGGGAAFFYGAAFSMGAAMATHYSGMWVIPVILFLTVTRHGFWRGAWEFAAMMFFALATVWACYFFEIKPLLAGLPEVGEKIDAVRRLAQTLFPADRSIQEFFVIEALGRPIPLASWFLGLLGIVKSQPVDMFHFFMGKWRTAQVWYYDVFSFFVKTTIPFLALLGWRVMAGLRKRPSDSPKKEKRKDLPARDYLLLIPLFLVASTVLDKQGLGIRALIPIMPFLWIWIGGLWPKGGSPVIRRWIIALLVLHALSSLYRFPNNIAYFNELAGGPGNGYRIARANNLERGQEVRNLGEFIKKQGIKKIRARLFGTNDPALYGMEWAPVKPEEFREPRKEVYAISVYYLDDFKWTYHVKPMAKIGHVIWVYDMREESKKRRS